MNLEAYLFIGSFFVMTLLGELKSNFHWKYLREVDPSLKKFKSAREYEKSVNMKSPNEYWKHFNISSSLLFPTFKAENNSLSKTSKAKYLERMTRYALYLYYFGILSFLGIVIYTLFK